MDQETFDFLKFFYGKGSVLILNTPLVNAKNNESRSLDFLKENHYLEYDDAQKTFKTTITGNHYIEQRLQNEHLIEIQKQNLELQKKNIQLQKSLRNCQYWLIAATLVSLYGTFKVIS